MLLEKGNKQTSIGYALSMDIDKLPQELVNMIQEYIPYSTLVFLNKHYYQKYHGLLRKHIGHYEKYVRDVIQRDNEYVFNQILRENMDLWIDRRNYFYKNMQFNNYIYFILYFCTEHQSNRCREILMDHFEKRDLCRNLHKKNLMKYITWKK